MHLYITEKKSVADVLASYFNSHNDTYAIKGKGFYYNDQGNCISWCRGHLLALFQPEHYNPAYKHWDLKALPIFPEPIQKRVLKQHQLHYESILREINKADCIYHVGDPDREGQLLVDEIIQNANYTGAVKRLLLNALDNISITTALKKIQDNSAFNSLFTAGNTMKSIDWLIGINLTRFFTKIGQSVGTTTTLPVGRVKSPTLALIFKTCLQHDLHFPTPYYVIQSTIRTSNGSQTVVLERETPITDESIAQSIQQELKGKYVEVSSIKEEMIEKTINDLYSLDTLQIEMNKLHALSPSTTLEAAQLLYEKGYTSFPRSDSKHLPEAQKEIAFPIIEKLLEKSYVIGSNCCTINEFTTNSPIFNTNKVTAHHAIVPTLSVMTDEEYQLLSESEKLVYAAICKRYIAAMYQLPYQEIKKEIDLSVDTTEYILKCKTRELLQDGYSKFYKDSEDSDIESCAKHPVQIFNTSSYKLDTIKIVKCMTAAPQLFTEGTLIHAMNHIDTYTKDATVSELEKLKDIKGIGTPSTRSTIIDELLQAELIYKEGNYLRITNKGSNLVMALPDCIKSPIFTANIELQLSDIELNNLDPLLVINDTKSLITDIINNPDSITQAIEALMDRTYGCPICHTGYLHKKHSTKTNHDFYACSNNECKFLCHIKTDGSPDVTPCPECNKGVLITKKGKFGNFIGCTNFPSCKYVVNSNKAKTSSNTFKKEPCPVCHTGFMVKKKGPYGEFIGCTNYPTCKHIKKAEK